MTAPRPSRGKTLLVVQLAAIALFSFGYRVWPTLFSSAPAYDRSWAEVLPVTLVLALIVFGLGRLSRGADKGTGPEANTGAGAVRGVARGANKGLTVVLIIAALIVPTILLGLGAVVWFEQASDSWEARAELRKAMDRDHVENLAAYLESPGGTRFGQPLEPEQAERLAQYAATLPPQTLAQHQVAEHLLQGLALRLGRHTSELPEASLAVLCRLFADLQKRTGFSPDALSLEMRQRARIASRVAELGLEGWRTEVAAEHPAFDQLSDFANLLYEKQFPQRLEQLFPQPLAPGERVVSRSLGSLPLYLLLQTDVLSDSEPGAPHPSDNDSLRERRQELRRDLELMKSRGIDFTEEERRDKTLQTFLKNIQEA